MPIRGPVWMLFDIPCIAFEEAPPDRKSIMVSRSFRDMIETREELEEAVATYAARAAEKMRRQSLAARRLMVFAHTNRFRPQDAQYDAVQQVALPVATADTAKLISAARRGLAALYRPGYRYKKAGVILLDPIPAREAQGGLFDAADGTASKACMRAVDALNRRYGRDTVTYAASGLRRRWKLRTDFISPRFTTCWDELLQV